MSSAISSGSSSSVITPQTPLLVLSYRPTKIFHFEWAGGNTATYKLKEKANSSANFVEVNGSIDGTATGYDYTVPLHKRVNAEYILQACNGDVCVDSNTVSVVSKNMAGSIGYIKASNTDKDDEFGKSVALSSDGKTLAVGAYHEQSGIGGINNANSETDNTANDSGAVYVYQLNGSVWEKQAYIKAQAPVAEDDFGTSIGISEDGNTLVVGARGKDTTIGSAYVFTRNNGIWAQNKKLLPSEGQSQIPAGAAFGNAVSISDDGKIIAVGAPGRKNNAGLVYVFKRNSNNDWDQFLQPIAPLTTHDNDQFGYSVSLSENGQALAVGALGEASANSVETNTAAAGAGAAYLFAFDTSTWTQTKYFKAPSPSAGDQFGYRVSLSNNAQKLAVGAPLEDGSGTNINPSVDEGATDSGAVYLFENTDNTWQTTYIKSPNTQANDAFGSSVALSTGRSLVVGARGESKNATGLNQTSVSPDRAASGAAYVFTQSSGTDTWSLLSYLKASNTATDDALGRSVAISSDGNTVAVGAVGEASNATLVNGDQSNNSKPKAGAVYLY